MKMEGMGMTMMEQRYDGEKASVSQMGQSQAVEGDELEDIKENAIMFPEATYGKMGYELVLDGVENVNGSNAYKIVIKKDGEIKSTNYYDVTNSLKIRSVKIADASTGAVVTNDYANYKEVNGVKLPFEVVISGVGPAPMRMQVERVKVNEGIDDAAFKVE